MSSHKFGEIQNVTPTYLLHKIRSKQIYTPIHLIAIRVLKCMAEPR
jgi:hypothetical protein